MFHTRRKKEAQEAREWQEQFVEKRRRAQEALEEEWREQEKKRCGEDDDERVPVVPDMEAGSSYFKTTYPRDEVENIVMDELEERKTGRGSYGLVRGVRVQVSDEGDQWKGVQEREKEEKENMEAKEHPQSTRKVQDEEEEARGEDECREAKFQRDLRQLEERRRAQEEEERCCMSQERSSAS